MAITKQKTKPYPPEQARANANAGLNQESSGTRSDLNLRAGTGHDLPQEDTLVLGGLSQPEQSGMISEPTGGATGQLEAKIGDDGRGQLRGEPVEEPTPTEQTKIAAGDR